MTKVGGPRDTLPPNTSFDGNVKNDLKSEPNVVRPAVPKLATSTAAATQLSQTSLLVPPLSHGLGLERLPVAAPPPSLSPEQRTKLANDLLALLPPHLRPAEGIKIGAAFAHIEQPLAMLPDIRVLSLKHLLAAHASGLLVQVPAWLLAARLGRQRLVAVGRERLQRSRMGPLSELAQRVAALMQQDDAEGRSSFRERCTALGHELSDSDEKRWVVWQGSVLAYPGQEEAIEKWSKQLDVLNQQHQKIDTLDRCFAAVAEQLAARYESRMRAGSLSKDTTLSSYSAAQALRWQGLEPFLAGQATTLRLLVAGEECVSGSSPHEEALPQQELILKQALHEFEALDRDAQALHDRLWSEAAKEELASEALCGELMSDAGNKSPRATEDAS